MSFTPDERYHHFVHFNAGKWLGRATHFTPATGRVIHTHDYALAVSGAAATEDAPSHTVRYVYCLRGERAAETAAAAAAEAADGESGDGGGGGGTLAAVVNEFRLGDGSDADVHADDGSYTADHSMVDFPGMTAPAPAHRFVVELSIRLLPHDDDDDSGDDSGDSANDERVRCLAFYDYESKLSRVVLLEEHRDPRVSPWPPRPDDTDADAAAASVNSSHTSSPWSALVRSSRAPTTLFSLIGCWRGRARVIATVNVNADDAEPTHAEKRFFSLDTECTLSWDYARRVRRSLWYAPAAGSAADEATGPRDDRIVMASSAYGTTTPMPHDANRETSTASRARNNDDNDNDDDDKQRTMSYNDAMRDDTLVTFDDGKVMLLLPSACWTILPASLVDGDNGGASFLAEFGCMLSDRVRRRVARLYDARGRLSSSAFARERMVVR